MVRKIAVGGLAGGVALFVWGIVAWMLLPVYQSSLRTLRVEDELVATLTAAQTPRGFYVIPGFPARGGAGGREAAAEAEWEAKTRRGPVATLVYRPDGRAPNRMFRPMLRGLVLCLVAAMFSAWALSRARIGAHFGRVLFVLGLGLFGWLLGPGMQWHWFGYPVDFTLASLADDAVGWAIVGVVQAGLLRQKAP